MRFIVFGGGGDMGSRVVEELAVTPGVELVTIAGRTRATLERARDRALAAQTRDQALTAQTRDQVLTAQTRDRALPDQARNRAPTDQARDRAPTARGRPADHGDTLTRPDAAGGAVARVEIKVVDARDDEAVVETMRAYDVSLGALGPFYLYEEPMIKAAIAARTPYVSLCDDADAAADALAHDEAARAAGVTVLTGLGWTPGLTNVLALRGAARLDKVTSITVAWAGSAAESGGAAVALHTLHIFNGKVVTFDGGRHMAVQAGTGSEAVHFPAPLGRVRVCHVGHPEPLTLPEQIPGVQSVSLKGGLVEPTLHQLAVLTGRLGLARTHRMRTLLARLLVPLIPVLSRLGPKRPAISGVVVRVTGEKDGRPTTFESAATAPMTALTGVPMAVGALWMAQGRISRPGVLAPDAPGLIDPEPFLQELTRRGVPIADTMHTI